MITLSTPLKNLTRVGQSASGRLKKLGLTKVKDLLFYYPSRYEDYSNIILIKDARSEEIVTVKGKIVSIENKITPYKRQKITQAVLSDNTASIKAIWFNQPYLLTQLHIGDIVALAGKIEYSGFGLEMRSPEWEKLIITNNKDVRAVNGIHTSRIIPIYPLTAGITQRQVRFLVLNNDTFCDRIQTVCT